MAQGADDTMVTTLVVDPGIKRDGTEFDGNFYSDGNWVRFHDGRPKKMGGYRSIVNGLKGPVRCTFVQSGSGFSNIFMGSGQDLVMLPVDSNGTGSAPVDRTPAGFTVDPLVTWQMDAMFDSTGSATSVILAHASKYLADIADTTEYDVYQGTVDSVASLTAFTPPLKVSGGVCVVGPYAFYYGNNGQIKNSALNQPQDFAGVGANEANVSSQKIVKGLSIKGGGQAPAALFWGLDCLVRVSFVGGDAGWKYDIVSGQSSILSPNSVIEYDGVYYWAGVDRFLMYNGTLQEVPNPMNLDFFFDNLNWSRRCAVWATKIPRWGEIWWFFPKGDSVECNHAVIFNVREKTWYDTPINRSSGFYSQVLRFPIMTDSLTNVQLPGKYRLWQHEFGVDHVYDEQENALDSWYVTTELSYITGGPGAGSVQGGNLWTRLTTLELDFVQTGDMTFEVLGRQYPRGEGTAVLTRTFTDTDTHLDVRVQERLMQLKFRSNVQGGDYMQGRVIMHLEGGDQRR